MPPAIQTTLTNPPPSLIEIIRLAMDGFWPATPDLMALIDRMEMPR